MKKKFTWRRIVSLLFVVIVGYWAINNFGSIKGIFDSIIAVTLPFILGAALAFILNLPLKFFERYMTKLVGKYYTWYRIVGILGFLDND